MELKQLKTVPMKIILVLILLATSVSAKTFSTGYLSGDHEYLAYTNDRVLVFVYLGDPAEYEWFVFGINGEWFLLSDSVHALDADYKKHTYNFNHDIYFNFIVEFRVGDILKKGDTLTYFYAWSVKGDISIGDIVTIKDP